MQRAPVLWLTHLLFLCRLQMVVLDEENYINLATKSVQFAAQKLLKKSDQCRAIAHAAGAFWGPVRRAGGACDLLTI